MQNGFREEHSTQRAIIYIVNTIQHMDKRLYSCGVSTDLKKNFRYSRSYNFSWNNE